MSYDEGRYHPTLLTGDLNANTNSEVYHLITQGISWYSPHLADLSKNVFKRV